MPLARLIVPGMGSAKSPPPPPPVPPPVRVTGADRAKAADQAAIREKRRYSFENTIIAGRGGDNPNMKSTLG